MTFNFTDEEVEEAIRQAKAEKHRQRQEDFEAECEAERAREKWAAAEARRRDALRRRRRQQDHYELPFVPTTVAKLVADLIGRCLRFGQNSLIIGAPGVGKTRALKEAVRRSAEGDGPEVGLVTISAVVGASTMAVFEEICPHLGVYPMNSIAATMKRLRRETDDAPVLLFDEAQNLTLKSARELLAISE